MGQSLQTLITTLPKHLDTFLKRFIDQKAQIKKDQRTAVVGFVYSEIVWDVQ